MKSGTIFVIKGKPENYKPGTFTTVDSEALGKAIQELNKDAIKLYCYLIGNKSGYRWGMNATAYARWLGVLKPGENFENENRKRTITMSIDRGRKELIKKSYLKEITETEYEFYEKGTNCSCIDAQGEQIVQDKMPGVNKLFSNGNQTGTTCSYEDARDEQIVLTTNPDGSYRF